MRSRSLATPARTVAVLAATAVALSAIPLAAIPLASAAPVPDSAPAGVTAPTDPATCGGIPIPATIAGLKPGDLVGSEAVTPGTDSNGAPLLTGASAWRILYISSGADETSPQLVCGLVAAPTTWTPANGIGRVIAWAHGTVGIKQKCQPSNRPDKGLFGPMPGGIGAVSWSTGALSTTGGTAANGALQTLINDGYVVAATDYYSGITPGQTTQGAYQHYAVGMPSGANVLDSVRAAIPLVDPGATATRWDMLTWGHSQGGGSALWAAQLARSYLSRTQPTNPVAPIRLVGVAAAAPATSFTAPSTAKGQLMGYHLGDLDMHMNIPVALGLKINVGAMLFSYVLPNWAELSVNPSAPGARFPAMPPTTTPLQLSSMLASKTQTPGGNNGGLESAPMIADLCLSNPEADAEIAALTEPFANFPTRAFYFVEQIWGRASEGYTKGYLDQTCATSTDAGIQQWCRWLRYNQPGPNGQNPFDKIPRNESGPVPVYVMQGEADNILYCMPADPSNPLAKECLAKQFYESMKPAYCPSRGPASGSLQLNLWPKQVSSTLNHPASHMSIPGQSAAPVSFAGKVSVDPNLTFTDSPLYAFMTSAFTNPSALPRGCHQQVMWASSGG